MNDEFYIENFKKQISCNISYYTFLINHYKDDPKSYNSYLKILSGLYDVKFGACTNPLLIMDLINPSNCKMGRLKNFKQTIDDINDSQYKAVSMGLAMNNLMILEGPPGTGKSTFITELIKQLKMKDDSTRVLVTSQSHYAVNNVIQKIIEDGRYINQLARIRQKESSDYHKYSEVKIFNDILSNVDSKLRKILNSFNNDSDERYSNDFLKNNVSMILTKKSIVGVTCNSIPACNFEKGDPFDYVIVDEVGQFSFAELINVAKIARKLILIGDPKQLPAVLKNSEKIIDGDKEKEILFSEFSGFNNDDFNYLKNNNYIEFLFNSISNQCKTKLDEQFRMSNAIGAFISKQFYNNKVINGRDMNVEDSINFIDYSIENKTNDKIDNDDSKGENSEHINQTEINLIKQLIKEQLLPMLKAEKEKEKKKENKKDDKEKKDNEDSIFKSVAIICPYKMQVEQLKKQIINIKNISTIDSFQGQEFEYVIFSCTRCSGTSRFLDDSRRINVAVSRAKKKIFIVGNSEYLLKNTKNIKSLLNFEMEYVHPKTYKKYHFKCKKLELGKNKKTKE